MTLASALFRRSRQPVPAPGAIKPDAAALAKEVQRGLAERAMTTERLKVPHSNPAR